MAKKAKTSETIETLAPRIRAAFSAMREADVQVSKADEQLEKASRKKEGAHEMARKRRLEFGKLLVQARKLWPATGGGGWGEFLKSEGIDRTVAKDAMKYAGYVEDQLGGTFSDVPPSLPSLAEAGIDKRPRLELVPKQLELVAPDGFDLRLGDWRTTLANVGRIDALITDTPYSEETHAGSEHTRNDGSDPETSAPNYPPWTPADVDAFVDYWAPRTRGWMVSLTDDVLAPVWRAAYRRHDRFAFAPVGCVILGMNVRRQGDGPSSWLLHMMVSRPRTGEFAKWGTLPGAYVGKRVDGAKHGRGKPPWLMQAIVGDYSRAGDLVCDPLAGYGETLRAALQLRRRAVGAEIDPAAVTEAIRRATTPAAEAAA